MPAAEVPGDPITIYAELLLNIRQLSVVASLLAPSDSSTRAEVADSGREIRVHHHGHIQTMVLPALASASISPLLPVPRQPSLHLNWRLPLSEDLPKISAFSLESQALPWNAVDIRPGSPFGCRKCGHAVVQDGFVKSWKDLPSENWAEMMEFWHCHKPHDHGQSDDEYLTKRGYGASNSISAQEGVGFVDITSFNFAESDSRGLLFSSSSPEHSFDESKPALAQQEDTRFLHIYCGSCRTEVGLYNVLTLSVSLFKWQVSCKTTSPGPAPSSTQCLAAALTATISRSGSAKSVILPHKVSQLESLQTESAKRALHLWVLNPKVTYASSRLRYKRNAMKILYQTIDVEKGIEITESMNSDIQDIVFPLPVIAKAHDALELSNLVLPEKERSFKEWKVGLMERWDEDTRSN